MDRKVASSDFALAPRPSPWLVLSQFWPKIASPAKSTFAAGPRNWALAQFWGPAEVPTGTLARAAKPTSSGQSSQKGLKNPFTHNFFVRPEADLPKNDQITHFWPNPQKWPKWPFLPIWPDLTNPGKNDHKVPTRSLTCPYLAKMIKNDHDPVPAKLAKNEPKLTKFDHFCRRPGGAESPLPGPAGPLKGPAEGGKTCCYPPCLAGSEPRKGSRYSLPDLKTSQKWALPGPRCPPKIAPLEGSSPSQGLGPYSPICLRGLWPEPKTPIPKPWFGRAKMRRLASFLARAGPLRGPARRPNLLPLPGKAILGGYPPP